MTDFLTVYRVFPRLFAAFYFWLTMGIVEWYKLLPDPSEAQSAVVMAICASAAAYFKFYVDTRTN